MYALLLVEPVRMALLLVSLLPTCRTGGGGREDDDDDVVVVADVPADARRGE